MGDDFHANYNKGETEYYVDAEPFGDILNKSHLKYVDLMTIDVEGGELMALETMDWSIPVYVIVIECHAVHEEKNEKCRNVLLSQGFVMMNHFCGNEFWVNPSYFRKELLWDPSTSNDSLQGKNLQFHFMANHCLDETLENVGKVF